MKLQSKIKHLQDIIESGHADSQTYDVLNRLAFRHQKNAEVLRFYSHGLKHLSLAQQVEVGLASKKLQALNLSTLSGGPAPRPLPSQFWFLANPRTARYLTWIAPSLAVLIAAWLLLSRG